MAVDLLNFRRLKGVDHRGRFGEVNLNWRVSRAFARTADRLWWERLIA